MDVRIVRALLVATAVAALFAAYKSVRHDQVHAQPATVDFVVSFPVPAPIATPNPPGDEGDLIIFTGRSSGTSAAGKCGEPGVEYPVQPVVVIDPGTGQSGRALHHVVVVVVSQAEPVPPGTKLRNLSTPTECFFDLAHPETFYTRFRGEVQ